MFVVLNETEDKVLALDGWLNANQVNLIKNGLSTQKLAERRLKLRTASCKEAIDFWSEETEMTGDNPPRDPRDIVKELETELKVFKKAKVKEYEL